MDEATKLRILVKQLQKEIKELKAANESLYLQCEQAQADVQEAKLNLVLFHRGERALSNV